MRLKYIYLPVIFLYTEYPSAQDVVRYMKLLYEIALFEHPNGSATRIFVGEIEIDERETVKIICFRGRDSVGDESQSIFVVGGRVITQTFESHLLLRHQLACGLVHLRIVNAEAAEDGECLEYRYIRVGERRAVILQGIFFTVNN